MAKSTAVAKTQVEGLNPFLGLSQVPDYVPNDGLIFKSYLGSTMPIFTPAWIRDMLRDPRVQFGMRLIKGPIAQAKFTVDTDGNEQLKTFIEKNIERFWRKSVTKVLNCLAWGFSCSEVFYRRNPKDGLNHFYKTKYFHPGDAFPQTIAGRVVGVRISVQNTEYTPMLAMPRFIWCVNEEETNPILGVSRLYGSFPAFIEKWGLRGQRQQRSLWFAKYAYDGGTIRYPEGGVKEQNGQERPNKEIARELIEKKATGGSLALPAPKQGAALGESGWSYEPPAIQPPPEGIKMYGDDLNDELLEGMGIPPEIARASGTGAYAGRAVPLEAFYNSLDEIVHYALESFDYYILSRIVRFSFGEEQYEITPVPLIESKAMLDNLGQGGLGQGTAQNQAEGYQQAT